jgi:2-isopropylmalate synthase
MTGPDLTTASLVERLDIYDTTLRDGAQQEGLALSVRDKLTVLGLLDDLGVRFIEGGWPGAIPKDTEFFDRARSVPLKNAVLVAFGSTRKAGVAVEDDAQVAALLAAQTPVVTLVAKSDSRHVELALRTTPEENLAMVADTVGHLVARGRRVFLDAEHFFDGYRADPGYALAVLGAASAAGAEVLVLCDTNGGMLPDDVAATVTAVRAALPEALLGIHTHNDSGCAVANALAAIKAGAVHVQGTINGYGERTGNADLTTIVANLELKLGRRVLPAGALAGLTHTAHTVAEVTNIAAHARSPYVGSSAFAHKAGLHASAIRVDDTLYQHVEPASVGNDRRMLVSEMAGRASVELKAAELGFDVSGDPELVGRVVARVKAAEAAGYAFDAADASFDLLLREEAGHPVTYCDVESWQVHTASHTPGGADSGASEAIVRLRTGDARSVAVGEGNGPVNALDSAIRSALGTVYPELEKLELTDFRVRILDSSHGTDAITRVLVATTDERGTWTTVGVGANIIESSWEALFDGLRYGLLRQGVQPR